MVKFAQGSKITIALVKFLDYPKAPFSPQEHQTPIVPCSLICSYVAQSKLVKEVKDKKIFNFKYGEKVVEKMSSVEDWFVKIVPLTIEEKIEVFELPKTEILCPDLAKISGDTVGSFNNLNEIITWAEFNTSSVEINYLLKYEWQL